MGDEIKISIKDSCQYIPREKRDECWKGEDCNEFHFDNYFGWITCEKVIREICGSGRVLDVGDELSIIENAYGHLSHSERQEVLQTRKEILLDRLEEEIEKAFSKENVYI